VSTGDGAAGAQRQVPGAAPAFDAFLSYSHAADGKLAPTIQRGLHRLAKRWTQLRALRVFRDQSSLAANPDLWATIDEALRDARYFVLLASPEAARSEWVQREVGFWQEHRDRETFLIVLTGGEIYWDTDRGDFDWQRTNALPDQLSGWFHAEPLWVDLSWARAETDLTTRHPGFRNAVGTLAAAIHGIPKDELDSEDVRQHRLAARLRRATAAVLVVLLVVSLVATVIATHQGAAARRQRDIAQQQRDIAQQQRDIAQQQRDIAQQQRRLATGRALIAEAANLRHTRPRTALQLSLAAQRVDPTTQARAGLVATLMETRYAGGSLGSDRIDGAAFSRDGRMLATISRDRTVDLWEVTPPTGRNRLAVLTGHTGAIQTIAFSPDGRTLATAGEDRSVILWDLAKPTRPQRVASLTGLTGLTGVDMVAFSPDGTTLAAVGVDRDRDGALILWDIDDRGHPRHLATQTGVYDSSAVVFSPQGRTLVTSTSRLIVKESPAGVVTAVTHGSGATIWDLTDRTRPRGLFRIHPASETSAFSPDSRLLAIAHGEGATLWDLTDHIRPRQIATLSGHTDVIQAMAFSPDGRALATTGLDNTAILWDVTDPTRPTRSATLTGHTSSVAAVVFDQDGAALTTADSDGTIARWRRASRAPASVATLTGHTSGVQAAAFSPDNRALATASFDRTVILWDITDPARPHRAATLTGHTGPVRDVAFSPDGTSLASVGDDGITLLWDVTDRLHPHRLATLSASTPVTAVAFNPRAALLVTAGGKLLEDGWAALWDIADRSRPRKLVFLSGIPGIRLGTRNAVFSPDGKILAIPDGLRFILYSVAKSSAPVLLSKDDDTLRGRGAAFSPDGKTLATTDGAGTAALSRDAGLWDRNAGLWDITTPSRPRHVADLAGHSGMLSGISFHPNGKLLATASQDSTAILWAVADPVHPIPAATLRAHTDGLTAVAFSPDGRRLVTASEDDTAILWDTGGLPDVATDATRIACDIAGPGLTPKEWKDYAPGIPYQRSCP
jgi:WD40 repeat protein